MFVLLSDGELDEGSNCESILFSSHHKLSNLVIIIDYNKLQSTDSVKNTLNLEPLDKKFKSFGFKVVNINGHNHDQIFKALNSKSLKPLVVIANTIKGKGVSFMENSVLWHYKSLNSEDYQRAMKIIK
jgi:transketolase